MAKYYIEEADITLTMPDDTTVQFTMETPNTSNPYWFRIIEEAPSGERIYKDPSRTRQKAFADYYPEFHFNYGNHMMFTSMLLVAKSIGVQKYPPFDSPVTVECLLQNDSVIKNWFAGMPIATDSVVSLEEANPVPSGDTELVFIGKEPMTWQEVTNFTFYQNQ